VTQTGEPQPAAEPRWVVLDVGETLVDETRIWSTWADVLGVPRLTLLATLGATIARGGEFREPLELFGGHDWRARIDEVENRLGGMGRDDLYPDAAPAIDALRAAGYRVAISANQPAIREEQLRASGIEAEVMAMSDSLGVVKPDPAFFARTLELMGSPAVGDVAYVGDRVDNDVLPAIATGMRAVWIRRGPWGVIQELPDGAEPALVVSSLGELVERIGEVWRDELTLGP
jgi:HAD superfamily hydrolase (TIGR01549 family)